MPCLIITVDLECEIFVDTLRHGVARADCPYKITLPDGVYWIECRSVEDRQLYKEFDFDTSLSNEEQVSIALLYELRRRKLLQTYGYVGDFQYGFAEVRKDTKTIGYVDTSYTFCYDDMSLLGDGLLRVKREGMYGVVNGVGDEIVPLRYNEVVLLGETLLRLKLNDRYSLATKSGRKITPQKYRAIEYALNGNFALYFDKWTLVDASLREVTLPGNVLLYVTSDGMVANAQIAQSAIVHREEDGACVLILPDDVKTIEEKSFYECKNLTSITLPEGLTTIGKFAFLGCRNLTSITLPEGLTTIGESAFLGCRNLTSITLPDGLTTIGKCAFFWCENFRSIIFPDSLTTIGERAFCRCRNLEKFSGKFASADGRCLIDGGTLIAFASAGLTEYALSDGLTTIGESAFWDCYNLTTITLPDSLTTIGDKAFSMCSNLTSITLPDGLITIGEGAFSDCSNLTSITLPDGLTTIGERTFSDCENLMSITLPEGLTTIGEYAFSSCVNLTSITLPEGLTTIGEGAFLGCKNLKVLTIPQSVTTIGAGAFIECTNLEFFSGKFVSQDGRCLIVDGVLNSFAPVGITNYAIPEGVKMIAPRVFAECENLSSISIPEGVESIKSLAFSHCTQLSSITIPQSVTSVSPCIFSHAVSLRSIYMKGLVSCEFKSTCKDCFRWDKAQEQRLFKSVDVCVPCTLYDKYASHPYWKNFSLFPYDYDQDQVVQFDNQIWYSTTDGKTLSLKDATFDAQIIKHTYKGSLGIICFDKEVTQIGNNTFSGSENLQAIFLPKSVTTIGEMAFCGCSQLVHVTLPDSLVEIGSKAFAYCNSLEDVVVPASVETIGNHAFYSCRGPFTINCSVITGHSPSPEYPKFRSVSEKYLRK